MFISLLTIQHFLKKNSPDKYNYDWFSTKHFGLLDLKSSLLYYKN